MPVVTSTRSRISPRPPGCAPAPGPRVRGRSMRQPTTRRPGGRATSPVRVEPQRAIRSVDPPRPQRRSVAFPLGIPGRGATPGGRGRVCENTLGPEPVPGPRPGGSLPSTSVLPSAAQAAGWQRPQLQAPARDSRIRRLRIFTGAMRASTPNVSCTLQYGTRRGLLIGSVPPRAEPSARCRCVASAPALPACAPASSARRCASSRPASLRTPSGPGHPP